MIKISELNTTNSISKEICEQNESNPSNQLQLSSPNKVTNKTNCNMKHLSIPTLSISSENNNDNENDIFNNQNYYDKLNACKTEQIPLISNNQQQQSKLNYNLLTPTSNYKMQENEIKRHSDTSIEHTNQVCDTGPIICISTSKRHLSAESGGLLSRKNTFNEKNSNQSKKVVINVSGIRYETYNSTLKLIPESRLANLSETNSDYDQVKNEYFFDRHPGAFLAILNYFRTGKLHAPLDLCGSLFYEELNFWGIKDCSIEPCCWTNYNEKREADEALKKLLDNIEEIEDDGMIDMPITTRTMSNDSTGQQLKWKNHIASNTSGKCQRFYECLHKFYKHKRIQVWKFFKHRNSSNAAKVYFWFSLLILFISLINFVLKTSPVCRIPYEIANNFTIPRHQREDLTRPHNALKYIEICCNAFFTLELLLKFLSSPNKMRFMRSPYNLLECLAILPFFFPMQYNDGPKTWAVKAHNYLEVLYILRILRIFALVPKYSGLRVLVLTMKTSVGELLLYSLLLLMTVMLFASFVFYAEQVYESERNQFESILIGLWWAIVTMTTLGYGDVVPVTLLGRVVGALCALCGVLFLALPIPVIVNNFTTFYGQAKAHQRLRSYLTDRKGLFSRAIALHLNNIPVAQTKVGNSSNTDSLRSHEFKKKSSLASFKSLSLTEQVIRNENNLITEMVAQYDKDENIRTNSFKRNNRKHRNALKCPEKDLEF